jgi:dTDP-4-dehydrorhamnose reductase
MTSWLITGAGGMLGRDLVALLQASGAEVTAADRGALDITDGLAVTALLDRVRPDVVVNCAAWTAVDDAEAHEDLALAVNGSGAANLATACAGVGARLMQPSTDYVFSGTVVPSTGDSSTGDLVTGARPYAEDEEPAPRTAYGRTKLAGEQAVLRILPEGGYVLRTAWLYGAHGPNFVRTMIRLEAARDTVAVVDDQHGQPTWTEDVARQILLLAESEAKPGIYHATSSGQTTWFGLARAVFELLGADPGRVTPTSSSELARPAPRPAYSVLGHAGWASAGLPPLPDWRYSLQQAFPDLAAAEGRPNPATR